MCVCFLLGFFVFMIPYFWGVFFLLFIRQSFNFWNTLNLVATKILALYGCCISWLLIFVKQFVVVIFYCYYQNENSHGDDVELFVYFCFFFNCVIFGNVNCNFYSLFTLLLLLFSHVPFIYLFRLIIQKLIH